MTLTLEWDDCDLKSVCHLTEMDIIMRENFQNMTRGLRDMEWTQVLYMLALTLCYNLDLDAG